MVVVDIGYHSLVLDKDDALALIGILERSERYEQKYWSKADREERGMPAGAEYTYHVYPNEQTYVAKIISNDLYNMAKLAGKPEKG